MFTHRCIKPGCAASYTSEDPEPYYCETHDAERLALAAEIDAHARAPKPQTSEVQELERNGKMVAVDGMRLFMNSGG